MSESFGNSWTVVLLNFILICCYIHIVYGQVSVCTSAIPFPHSHFERQNHGTCTFQTAFPFYISFWGPIGNKLFYVKSSCLELARRLHRHLNMKYPRPICVQLAGIDTTTEDSNGNTIEMSRDSENMVNLLTNIEETASILFNEFNTMRLTLNISVPGEFGQRLLHEFVNKAIHRLVKSGYYGTQHYLVEEIRRLKATYSPGFAQVGLTINDIIQTEPPSTTEVLYKNYPMLLNTARNFILRPTLRVPEQNSLLVFQNEIAVTNTNDANIQFIGATGASRCIIVVLMNADVQTTVGLSYICDIKNSIKAVHDLIQNVRNRAGSNSNNVFALYLVGGFADYDGLGDDVFYHIMKAVHMQDYQVHLMGACVGIENTVILPNHVRRPKVRGIAMNLWKNAVPAIVPANFKYVGPDHALRIGRILVGNSEIVDIYDLETGLLKFGPFFYDIEEAPLFREYSKEQLLDLFGDLPEMKDTLKYLEEYPYSFLAFPNDVPHYFRRNILDRVWVQVNDP